jgi:hypothetical protein
MRSCQLRSHSRTSQHFMAPESSSPCSQESSTILSQIDPLHTINTFSLRSILILPTHLYLGLRSGLFLSSFPPQYPICIPFLPHSCYMPCPSHPPWLDDSNNVWENYTFLPSDTSSGSTAVTEHTYLLTYGAEPFPRSCQLCSHPGNSQQF